MEKNCSWMRRKKSINFTQTKTDRLTWTIVCITSLGTWWKSYTVRSTVLRGRVSTWPWPRLQSAPACHRAGSVRTPTCPLTVDCKLMNLEKIDVTAISIHEQVTKETHYILTFLICFHFHGKCPYCIYILFAFVLNDCFFAT